MSCYLSVRAVLRLAILTGVAMALAGCATCPCLCPRIDPSGDRVFLWPGEPGYASPAPVATSPFGPPATVPPPGTMVVTPATGIGAPMGNMQAPPVYSDPNPIGMPTSAGVVAPGMATVVAPGAAPLPLVAMRPAGVPTIATPVGTCAPQGVQYLRVTPNGIMAPIGTEIVFKAGAADCDGSLLVNRSVEWGISGVGQFTDMRRPELVGYFAWPWQLPQVLAANHAVGRTALAETTLYRGTPDANDDVPVFRGESWVTISSACEGTSLVTAFVPSLGNYNRVTVTVYWVDAQFYFPPSAIAEPRCPHTLTTTVTRKSDNAPLAGWTVIYNVANGASLGYEGGSSVQATTDASGRASVEVSPVGGGSGTSNVEVAVFRPAITGSNGVPQLGLGRGNATITWGATIPAIPVSQPSLPPPPAPPVTSIPAPPPANPYSPNPYTVPSQQSPYTPGVPPAMGPTPTAPPPGSNPPPSVPSNTPATRSPDPYTPPTGAAATGTPRLEMTMSAATPAQAGVGEYVSFNVTVTNRGDGVAQAVKVESKFDAGLKHPTDTLNKQVVNYEGIGDLAPGRSASVPLTFQVVQAGRQCQTVTVTAEGANTVTQNGCVNAVVPAMELRMTAPRSRVVGEIAEFNVVVQNGDVPAKNVLVIVRFDPSLEPAENYERLADGSIALRVGDLTAPERRLFPIKMRCRAAATNACGRADLTADGGVTTAQQACVEILPPSDGGGVFQ